MLIILLVTEHFESTDRMVQVYLCDIFYFILLSCLETQCRVVYLFIYLFIHLFYKVAKFECMNKKGK